MKKISWLLAAVLPIALTISCQKEVASTSTSRAPHPLSAANCGTCVNSWAATAETLDLGFSGITIDATQISATKVTLFLKRAAGFTKANYKIDFTDVSASSTTNLLTLADPSAAGGSQTVRDLTKTKTGGATSWDGTLPANAEACDYVTITINDLAGAGWGNQDPISVRFYIRALCPPPSCTQPITLTGEVTGIKTHADDANIPEGFADITCTYTVTTCGDFPGGVIRTQGGATAGSSDGASRQGESVGISEDPCSGLSAAHTFTTGNVINYPNVTLKNIVYSWSDTFVAGPDCRTYSFTYRRAISGGEVVTGDWSSTGPNGLSDTEAPLTASF